MRQPVVFLIILLSIVRPAYAFDDPRPQSPVDDFTKIMDEYTSQIKAFSLAYKQAKTDNERQKAIKEKSPDPRVTARRLWTLSTNHPENPMAIDALVWVATQIPDDPLSEDAMRLLLEHHIRSEKIGPLCHQLFASACRKPHETLDERRLRDILDLNPDKGVQAVASFELGMYLRFQIDIVKDIKIASPEQVRQAQIELGVDAVARLLLLDPNVLLKECESLFRRSRDCGASIRYYFRKWGTLAEAAQLQLDEMLNLAIGKVAPQIVGEDIDGATMKLDDYRGKVVVISFWASWCAPCMEMVPHEKSLVGRLQGKPFALLGVNGDPIKNDAVLAAKREKIDWRSWWGEGQDSRIITDWNVISWPTTYVLDPQGVIRYKNVRGKELDAAVDALIEEMKNRK